LDEIQANEDLLYSLGEDLSGLWRKLPAEYRRGPRAIDPTDPARMGRIVNDAHALLLKNLKQEGGSQ